MAYQDVRGPDGKMLFRLDPDRLVIEIVVKGSKYVVDLADYLTPPAYVEIDPFADVERSNGRAGASF